MHDATIHPRLINQLYTEAMLLADEARGYFDEGGRAEREALEPMVRVAFSCESLKVTTRLMHVIAWLLTQRAVAAGEMRAADGCAPSRRLGEAPYSDPSALAAMPPRARALIDGSIELFRRAARLDATLDASPPPSPARDMIERLRGAF